MRLYHRTTLAAANAVLADGFRDGSDAYMTEKVYSGVWLSDEPISFTDGIPADWVAILEVDLPAALVAPYEWIEPNSTRREFLVPAAIVNAAASPLLTIEEA